MRYVVQCVKCKRPADIKEQQRFNKRDCVQIKTVTVKMCACGGEIKAMME